jgi:hypothetical protein
MALEIFDKILYGVIAFVFIALCVPLGIGFINGGQWTVTIGSTTQNLATIAIFLTVAFVLLLIVVLVRAMSKGD